MAYQLLTLQPLWNYFAIGMICLLRQFLQVIYSVAFTAVLILSALFICDCLWRTSYQVYSMGM